MKAIWTHRPNSDTRDWQLPGHIVLWLGSAVTLLSGLLVVMALAYLHAQTLESGYRQTESHARLIEEQTTRTLQNVDQRLELAATGIAELSARQSLNEQSARNLLREQIKAMAFVRAMWVMDAQGTIVYDSDFGNVGVNLASRAYFQIYANQPQTSFFVGTPVRNRAGIWVISASRPLRAANGKFAGIVVAALEPGYFDQLWQSVNLGDGSVTSLFHRNGVLMMRSPFDDALMGKPDAGLPIFKSPLQNTPAGSFQNTNPSDGVLRSYAYRALSDHPERVVVVSQPYDLTLESWRQSAAMALSIWAAAALVIALLCIYLDARITEIRRAQGLLQEERNFNNAVLDNAGALLVVLDREGRICRFNRAAEDVSGRTKDEVLGKFPWHTFLPPEIAETVRREAFESLVSNPKQLSNSYTNEWLGRSGERRLIEWTNTLVANTTGQIDFVVAIGVDITERRTAEEALKVSLHEKVALLREVHHRVKNNLQVVTSLLRMERGRSQHADTRSVLADMQDRIRSMALLHESIYRADNFTSIDLGHYVRQVATQAFRTNQMTAGAIELRLDLDMVQVGLDQAMPVGLLVSELISNSLKHGFPDGRTGEVYIELLPVPQSTHWRLRVSDTGIGLPVDFDARTQSSLGMQLMSGLAVQLESQLEAGPGAVFSVEFQPKI